MVVSLRAQKYLMTECKESGIFFDTYDVCAHTILIKNLENQIFELFIEDGTNYYFSSSIHFVGFLDQKTGTLFYKDPRNPISFEKNKNGESILKDSGTTISVFEDGLSNDLLLKICKTLFSDDGTPDEDELICLPGGISNVTDNISQKQRAMALSNIVLDNVAHGSITPFPEWIMGNKADRLFVLLESLIRIIKIPIEESAVYLLSGKPIDQFYLLIKKICRKEFIVELKKLSYLYCESQKCIKRTSPCVMKIVYDTYQEILKKRDCRRKIKVISNFGEGFNCDEIDFYRINPMGVLSREHDLWTWDMISEIKVGNKIIYRR